MFQTIDWVLIILYLVFTFIVGLVMKSKADKGGLDSYFAGGRNVPWWWLGTSMVATTFAADTPLWVTGVVAKYGIAGNWFWWSSVISTMFMTFFFASRWRQAGVITDVELTEIRYGGKQAAVLRSVKALFSSLFVNCIILGWVFAAMAKITRPFIHWNEILGQETFDTIELFWPSLLVFHDVNNTLTIAVICIIIIIYSSAGGIRAVMFTDLFQFVIAMTSAIAFAYFAVDHVGGLSSLWSKLDQIYPDKSSEYTSFLPKLTGDDALMPLGVFLASIGFIWWNKDSVDGSGYISQRLNTAKSSQDAEKGALWYAISALVLRSWPWIMVGLVALVLYPVDGELAKNALDNGGKVDREMAYPILMRDILSPGWLGLVFLSLLAAFMSTVDTHINWGASYLANDCYKRFINPGASDKALTRVSRISVVLMSFIAIMVATQISSINSAWKFYAGMMAGIGLPHLLRWFWWRANAWTEITGMVTGLVMSIIIYYFKETKALPGEYRIVIIGLTSMLFSITVTLLTKPVSEEHMKKFIDRVQPMGFWKGMNQNKNLGRTLLKCLVMWLTSVASAYSLLFSIGLLLRLEILSGMALFAFGLILMWFIVAHISKGESDLKSNMGVQDLTIKNNVEQNNSALE